MKISSPLLLLAALFTLPLAISSCSSSDTAPPMLETTEGDPRDNAITCEQLKSEASYASGSACFATGASCPLSFSSLCEAGAPVAVCNASFLWVVSCQLPDAGSDASALDGSAPDVQESGGDAGQVDASDN